MRLELIRLFIPWITGTLTEEVPCYWREWFLDKANNRNWRFVKLVIFGSHICTGSYFGKEMSLSDLFLAAQIK